jgi:integrase
VRRWVLPVPLAVSDNEPFESSTQPAALGDEFLPRAGCHVGDRLTDQVESYAHDAAGLERIQGAEVLTKRPKRLPVVLTRAEVNRFLDALTGTYRLMAGLLYGSGLRLMECVRRRVKDVDFARSQIMVRDGKGQKDRVTILPQRFQSPLRAHLARVKEQHETDLAQGFGAVYL